MTHLDLEQGLLGVSMHVGDGSPCHEVAQRQQQLAVLAQQVVGLAGQGAEPAAHPSIEACLETD